MPAKGYKLSKESRQKISNTRKKLFKLNKINRGIGKNNPFFEKHHSKESIDKILKSRDNGNWLKSIRKSNSKPKTKEQKKQLSITISNLLANGKISSGRNSHKKGWYTSKVTHNNEYYESNYELIRMKQLDKAKQFWTKKHKIRIEYINEFGKYANYVPDFLVNNHVIEEVKPQALFFTKNNQLKFKAAKKFCKINKYEFKILTEKELHIND